MDWSSSSSSSDSDDSEIEDLLFDDDIEQMIMAHIIDRFDAEAKRKRRAPRSAAYAFPGTEL